MSDNRPWIRFAKKNHPDFQVDVKTNLMRVLHQKNIAVASSCRGEGICGNCRLFIVSGQENLSPATESEKFLREKYPIKPNQRISCQADVLGDIQIDASYW